MDSLCIIHSHLIIKTIRLRNKIYHRLRVNEVGGNVGVCGFLIHFGHGVSFSGTCKAI